MTGWLGSFDVTVPDPFDMILLRGSNWTFYDTEWFEWHSDLFVAPAGADVLSADSFGTQAFRLLRNVGVQFHPEVDAEHLRWWIEHGGRSALQWANADVDDLVSQTEQRQTDAHARCGRLVDWFIDDVAQIDPAREES